MATVWMRSKLQKMKPKVEPRYGLKTLAEHGPGKFSLHRVSELKDKTPVAFDPAMVRKVDAVPPREPIRRMHGNFKPVRAVVVQDCDFGSVLIRGAR